MDDRTTGVDIAEIMDWKVVDAEWDALPFYLDIATTAFSFPPS